MARYLLGLQRGLYMLEGEAGDFRITTQLANLQAVSLAVDPGAPWTVFCATYNKGLWRSDDAGEHWRPAGDPGDYHMPLPKTARLPDATTFVAFAPGAGPDGQHALFVGAEMSSLYRSDDGGRTFTFLTDWSEQKSKKDWAFPARPETHHVKWLAFGGPEQVYASIEFGAVLRSADGGRTFEERKPDSPKDAHVLLAHPRAPGRLYAACGDGFLERGRSWAESFDGGETWAFSSEGLEAVPYLYGLAVQPTDPDDIRIAVAEGPEQAHSPVGSSFVYRRDGTSWTADVEGYPTEGGFAPVLAADRDNPGGWFALSNFGLYAQAPGQRQWRFLAGAPEWVDQHPTCLVQVSS